MNDWYNDPPDNEPDCESYDSWRHWWHGPDPAYDTLEEKEQAYGEPIQPAKCPHGNEWGECDHCDYLGDIAYDAARERR